MNTYIFGMPPAGEVAQLPEYGVGTIPSPFREQLVSEYERHYPGVYIIAGIDTSKELLPFTTEPVKLGLM